MPRGGSKRGEKRGNAKGNAGRPEGSGGPNFRTDTGVIGQRKRRAMTPLSVEREERMRFLVHGTAADLMPKEAMLSAMRYFADVANQWREVMDANLAEAVKNVADRAKAAVYEDAAAGAEITFRNYMREMCDVAYKVAPYCHARLMGVVNDPNANMGGTGWEMLTGILKEIEERERPAMVIDNGPQPGQQTLAEVDR